ncbi:MAG: hypothetical protein EOS54_09705 [Mesorhizobium sp.]|uniref:T4SS efffector SepA family protein n=1 Tax=unclassified Mesorhizobium TaxID=325217 RepID=UPI000F7523A5|nr:MULTISPECIES: hypothetical protein [unclassified Mesorhizobium]AZO47245.1 hypothetical protein EJ073_04930 [Mesorhizobium sp. M4B.F.Ca.ET.058.02.1.1]RWC54787.1 MAG: hypothetical protein EOS54_09705 [Mesorhizobium sp.]RWD13983.1 MAG: hypothetical protein EOS74_18505 [Mesorhizobium sp.]RWD55696.1 MAG: hypothetical protein EOS75_17230 [Mesorhizobium sp.]TIW13876.1 MAG: hypothetical protein E5V66_01840 [Mesorhizobium sp.]
MMPVIRINDATFSDLKSISTWFGTKTPTETIDRIVREAMEQLGLERDDEPEEAISTDGPALHFTTAPGLAFTKPLKVTINSKNLPSPRWASILLTMIKHVRAKSKLDGDALVGALGVPAKAERFEDDGFKYHPDLGISVQGQSASDAWKEVDRLAKKWHIPVSVEFWWRQNSKAQYPGKTGILRSGE